MKIVNIMNFVRDYDPRYEGSAQRMFALTEKELELVQKHGFDNTFLLQYDALINPKYQTLLKPRPMIPPSLVSGMKLYAPLPMP